MEENPWPNAIHGDREDYGREGKTLLEPAALLLATVGFAATFWAWALFSPAEQSLLVAVPVIVGSLGRIPIGALTDRLGGGPHLPDRRPAHPAAGPLPRSFADSPAAYLVGRFFLGVGGTTSAIGVPFVNSWYPPERRGLALGVFGAGMGGM